MSPLVWDWHAHGVRRIRASFYGHGPQPPMVATGTNTTAFDETSHHRWTKEVMRINLRKEDLAVLDEPSGKFLEECLWYLATSAVRAQGLSTTSVHKDLRTTYDRGIDAHIDCVLTKAHTIFEPGHCIVISCKASNEGAKAHLLRQELLGQLNDPPGGDRTHLQGLLKTGTHYYWVSTLTPRDDERATFRREAADKACDELASHDISVNRDQIHIVWGDHLRAALEQDFSVAARFIPRVNAIYEREFKVWQRWHQYDHGSVTSTTTHWRTSDDRAQFLRDIKSHLIASTGDGVMHIAGISGIGKTRLVIQACEELQADAPDLPGIFYQTRPDIDTDEWFCEASHGRMDGLRIILDECPNEISDAIRRRLASYPNVRVVTIGNEIQSAARTSRNGVRYLDPITEKDWVRALIESVQPSLSGNQGLIDLIINWSRCVGPDGRQGYDLRASIMLASVLKTATSEMNWLNFDVVWRRILKFFPNDIPADYTSQFMDAYSLLTVGSDIDLGPPPESRQTARTEELTYLARSRQLGNSGPLEKAKAYR